MLTGLFWMTAIFGVGVTVVDLLGLIGGGSEDAGAGADDSGGDDPGGGAHDGGGGAPVLSFLRWLRTLVYFCLGFGPFGLAAGAFGSGPVGSLVWSLAGGVSMSVLARLFFRFQRTRLDSSLHDEELLMEPGTVIVPIAAGSMGKVRVLFGQSVTERYARAEDGSEEFASGDRVVISRINGTMRLRTQGGTMIEGFIGGGAAAVVAFVLAIGLLRSVIRVCPPDQVLVVTGAKTNIRGKSYGFRLQRGGWTFVVPFFQSVQGLGLSTIPIDVRVEGVNSANGITVGADATACVCVDHEDDALLYSAVERLMGKSRAEIQEQIQQTMVGNFRGALNKTTPLQAIGMVESVEERDRAGEGGSLTRNDVDPDDDVEGERAQFRAELLRDSNQDLSTFGMRVVSVSLQKIWDTSNYIANLANKTLSRKRQEVEIEEARLKAQAERSESDANRREAVAENSADEQIIAAQQELEVLRRTCVAEVEQNRLEADSAIARADSEGERAVQEIAVELRKLKNVSDVTLEADTRRQAAEILADGENQAVQIVESTPQ